MSSFPSPHWNFGYKVRFRSSAISLWSLIVLPTDEVFTFNLPSSKSQSAKETDKTETTSNTKYKAYSSGNYFS